MTIQKQIRDIVAARIQAALPTVTVFRSLRREAAGDELPAVFLYSNGDSPSDSDADHAGAHERIYTLRVEVRIEERNEEDATDAMAVAIRSAILPDDADGRTLGGLVRRTTWEGQKWAGEEGDKPLSGTALDFAFHYLWRPE